MKISIQNNLKRVNDLNCVHKYSYFVHKQCTFLFSLTKITLNNSKNNMQYKHLNSGFKNCTSHFTLLLYSQSYRDQATRSLPYSHRALYKLHDYTRYKKCETRSKKNNRICIMAGYITVDRRVRQDECQCSPATCFWNTTIGYWNEQKKNNNIFPYRKFSKTVTALLHFYNCCQFHVS